MEALSLTDSHVNAKDLCNFSLSEQLWRLIPIKSNMYCWTQSSVKGEYGCNCCHTVIFPCLLQSYMYMNISSVQMCLGVLHKMFVSEIRCGTINSLKGNYCDRLKKKLNTWCLLEIPTWSCLPQTCYGMCILCGNTPCKCKNTNTLIYCCSLSDCKCEIFWWIVVIPSVLAGI